MAKKKGKKNPIAKAIAKVAKKVNKPAVKKEIIEHGLELVKKGKKYQVCAGRRRITKANLTQKEGEAIIKDVEAGDYPALKANKKVRKKGWLLRLLKKLGLFIWDIIEDDVKETAEEIANAAALKAKQVLQEQLQKALDKVKDALSKVGANQEDITTHGMSAAKAKKLNTSKDNLKRAYQEAGIAHSAMVEHEGEDKALEGGLISVDDSISEDLPDLFALFVNPPVNPADLDPDPDKDKEPGQGDDTAAAGGEKPKGGNPEGAKPKEA